MRGAMVLLVAAAMVVLAGGAALADNEVGTEGGNKHCTEEG
jgi:hypothetical protein